MCLDAQNIYNFGSQKKERVLNRVKGEATEGTCENQGDRSVTSDSMMGTNTSRNLAGSMMLTAKRHRLSMSWHYTVYQQIKVF